ncbi:carboxypeptidase-like regulatory domain-containing protein [Hugenholtzia roseola]|uniref:carboxypeptidase-like regulatory domain-containing protein n=1 Tax=Hugenholtzia roseola TaxID=1002 RepID=UPI0003F5CA0C|nr:carboxypeptidase-like regulatory domain-containing protein [Hugenholtzia roseola]
MKIQIPKPCDQDWAKMTAQDKGRHCASCQTLVVDFSRMNDQELIDFFKQNKVPTCGRFHAKQLNRPLLAPKKKNWLPHSSYVAAFLSFFAFKGQVMAQNVSDQQQNVMTQQVINPTQNKAAQVPFLLKGKVVGKNKEALSNVQIQFLNQNTQTDKYGYFEIEVSENQRLILSHPNYEVLFLDITAQIKTEPFVELFMIENQNIILDSVDMEVKIEMEGIVIDVSEVVSELYQKNTIKGKVTDKEGNALPSVQVLVVDTEIGTLTDANGNYQIDMPEGGRLHFSFVGYENAIIETIHPKVELNVILEEEILTLGGVFYGEAIGEVITVENKFTLNPIKLIKRLYWRLKGY